MKLIIQRDFDPEVAQELDTDCAIILENIVYWVAQNQVRGTNLYEGKHWTFNSTKAFQTFFPYLTEKQIGTRLLKLEEAGFIITGNFNKVRYDRTTWYTLGDRYADILTDLPFGKMEVTEWENGSSQMVKPIPNDKPNDKHNNNNKDTNNEDLDPSFVENLRAKQLRKEKPKSRFGISMPQFIQQPKKEYPKRGGVAVYEE